MNKDTEHKIMCEFNENKQTLDLLCNHLSKQIHLNEINLKNIINKSNVMLLRQMFFNTIVLIVMALMLYFTIIGGLR